MQLALLANLLYVSDPEDADCYADPELRTAFAELYEAADARRLNYRYAGGFRTAGDHMYEAHDLIKYDVINEVYYRYVAREGAYQNRTDDKNLGEFIKGLEEPLLRRRAGRLLQYSLYGWPKGYMRSIFTASDRLFPFNLIVCALLYLGALYLCIRGLLKKRAWELAVPMLIVLAFIVMSVTGITLTIYISMRYVSYNLGMFYLAYLILLMQNDRIAGRICKGREKDGNEHAVYTAE